MKPHLPALLALAAVSCASPGPAPAGKTHDSGPADDCDRPLAEAVATDDDGIRAEALTELAACLPGDDPLQDDLEVLLPVARQFADPRAAWTAGDQDLGEDGYLSGWFTLQVWPDNGASDLVPPRVSDAALRPVWALYRARLLVWHAIEHGTLQDESFAEARALFAEVRAAAPDHAIAALYLDPPEAAPPTTSAGLPAWAHAQADQLGGLTGLIDWWLDARQATDGQFGGGWGDDVELWRDWAPVLLGMPTARRTEAWALLADSIWALPRMEGGYSSKGSDVEHSAEDSADSLTPLLQLAPDDPRWTVPADGLAVLLDEVWLQENDRGERQFPGTLISADGVETSESTACDTVTHVRAVQPALLRWQQGALGGQAFEAWLGTWARAALRTSNDKPAGVVPSALRFPEGEAATGAWWDPGCFPSNAYAYPKRLTLMLRAIALAAHEGHPDAETLLVAMAESWRETRDETPGAEGTASWAEHEAAGALLDALAKRRFLDGDTRFDDLLVLDGDAYVAFLVGGDRASLDARIEAEGEAWRLDPRAWTSEVLFTDRVLKLHSRYVRTAHDSPVPRTGLLYQTMTGDVGDPAVLPLPAVRWHLDTAEGFFALVTERDPDGFTAELGTRAEATTVAPELLALTPGLYGWTLSCGDGTSSGEVAVDGPTRIEGLALPGDTLCRLEVVPR